MISFPAVPLNAFVTLFMAMSSTFPVSAQAPMRNGGQFVTRAITTEHGERRYKLFIPGKYSGSTALPLVVILHGCTQDPDDIARGTRMNDLADEKSVLVAYPEQPESANPKKCWNWYEPAHQKRDEGEPALIAAITRRAMADYRVDGRRVYVAGISAGAAMAVTVALSYPELYSAVGSHSGIPYAAAANVMEALAAMQGKGSKASALALSAKTAMGARARPISAILFQGGSDHVVNALNADQLATQLAAQGATSGKEVVAHPTEKLEAAGGYHYSRVVHRSGNTSVEVWIVDELGHAWSGGSTEGSFTDKNGPNATSEMMRFFLEHPRSSPGSGK
jgi:poly(hydroxyalkanoate) depolymerase family esterase